MSNTLNNNVCRDDFKKYLKTLGIADSLIDSFIFIIYTLRKKLLKNGICKTDANLSKLEYLWEKLFELEDSELNDATVNYSRPGDELFNMIQTQIDVRRQHLININKIE